MSSGTIVAILHLQHFLSQNEQSSLINTNEILNVVKFVPPDGILLSTFRSVIKTFLKR